MEILGLHQPLKTTEPTHSTAIETTTGVDMPATAQLAADKGVSIDEDDDDSYFELELTRTHYDAEEADFCRNRTDCSKQASTTSSSSPSSSDDASVFYRALDSTVQYSPEKPPPLPQSPTSIIPSSPTLQALMFPSKWTMKAESLKTRTTVDGGDLGPSPRRLLYRQRAGRLLSLRSRVEDASKFMIRRSNSSKSSSRISTWSSSSKRFSKLNLFRSLFSRLAWRVGGDAEEEEEEEEDVADGGFVCSPALSLSSSFRSPASKSWMWSSPMSGGGKEREYCQGGGGLRNRSRFWKSLEKSRSASSVSGMAGGSRRNDDYMMDGIEEAILHCKQSLVNPCTCRCIV